ncbi:hypothetical protein [Megasphaera stantonii]|uniref:Uncharacterized protein n=1 Tax=Megasphaera stantonii TaxID=2144175 RepID=A0A346AWW5_9FIRM|nr:hypothetical protein [Megasphaera stantonii]AXL20358.1 hypothetical protein DKB62_01560 [Megasphaera stantonii]
MNKTMHASFLVLYFIALVLAGTSPLFAAGAALVFFLVTSFQVLKMIVVLAVIIGGLCVLFPFLAPVAFILAVVFFIMRIRFIIRNMYAILAGAYVYGVLAAFGASHIGLLGYTTYALAAAAVLVLHVILKWLYRMGYTTKQAFGIMGLVPLLVVVFVLPFLKIPVVHGDVVVSPDVYPDAAPPPTSSTAASQSVLLHIRELRLLLTSFTMVLSYGLLYILIPFTAALPCIPAYIPAPECPMTPFMGLTSTIPLI